MIFTKRLILLLTLIALSALAVSCISDKPASGETTSEDHSIKSVDGISSVADETRTEDSINSENAYSEETSDEVSEEISEETSENAECFHPDGSIVVIDKYTYYDKGLSRFICPDCGYTYDIETEKVIKTGKTSFTYEETAEVLSEFENRYGLQVETIGTTVEGRNIYSCILGSLNSGHHVLIGAAMHGKEYMNTALLLDLIEYYTIGEGETYRGTLLFDYVEDVCFHIIPMINPDGVTVSQKGEATAVVSNFLLDGGYTPKNLAEYFRIWKSNANGVDLNRNFPAGWEEYKDTIGKPNYRLYKGPAPASEPETEALMEYTLKYDFDAVVSYHSYGEIIYWKYGNDKSLIEKCRLLANAVGNATRYRPVSPENEVAAGYKDWAMSVGIPALTIETGNVDTPLPDSQYKKIWNENWKVFAVIADWVKNNS